MKKIFNLITFFTLTINSFSQLTVFNNNVGIGTPNPTAKLVVVGGNIISQQFLFTRHIDGKDWNDNSTNGDLYLQWNNYTKNTYINPRGGNVGIGTISPDISDNWTTVLDVYGSTNSKSIVSTNTIKTGLWSHNDGYYGAPAGGITGTWTNHPFTLITNKINRITILANGNVGVGTSTPENSESWNKVIDVYGENNSKIMASSSTIKTGLWSNSLAIFGAQPGGITGTWTNHPFSIITNKTTKLTILANGNIGFGITNPLTNLHLKSAGNSIIRLHNSNDFFWDIGNYNSNIWSHVNSFTISEKDGTPWLIMNPVSKRTFLTTPLCVGGFLFEGNNSLMGPEAQNFVFRTNENGAMFTAKSNIDGEYSGLYLGGDFAAIYSPGDGYLLKVFDEDLMVNGDALKWYINSSGTAMTNSDQRRKNNINTIESAYDKVLKMRGVTYKFNKNNIEKAKEDSVINGLVPFNGDIKEFKKNVDKKNYGLIAQEIEQVIPEIVETDEKGYKYVDYQGIIPVLIEAIKEQDSIIRKQQDEINEIKKQLRISQIPLAVIQK